MKRPALHRPADRRLRLVLGPLATRPRLTAALLIGLAVGLGCMFGPFDIRPSTAAIFGWDSTCATFIVAMMFGMAGREPEHIRARSADEDEGQGVILALVIVAATASLAAIAAELSLAKNAQALERAARIGLAFATVAGSWLVVQLVFAVHYAHGYYAADDAAPEGICGGLLFPGKEQPDYWDFVHFAVVIGVASQTADIAFTSKPMRRIGTVHSAVAFTFNTVVLALTINLLAGLF